MLQAATVRKNHSGHEPKGSHSTLSSTENTA
jgi:hypothetical protein